VRSLDIENIIKRGMTAKGSPALSAEELIGCLGIFRSKGLFVQTMEAFEKRITGQNHPMRLDLSILGLEFQEDEIGHGERNRFNEIAEQKAKASIREGIDVEFIIWLDKT